MSLVTCLFLLSFHPFAHAKSKLQNREVSREKSELIVAIIDTGLDHSNPYFEKFLWKNPEDETSGWDFVLNKSQAQDFHGHGTHIAGLVLQNLQVEDHVRIMILKYYDQRFPTHNTVAASNRAFAFALAHGAHIINYSGGGYQRNPDEESLLRQARDQGVLVIAAAGNNGSDNDQRPFFPASYGFSNTLSVSAVDSQGHLLASSNFGRQSVHLLARGRQIQSWLLHSQKGPMTGTSQATAQVTNIAIHLLLERPWLRDQPAELIANLEASIERNDQLRSQLRAPGIANLKRSLAQFDKGIDARGQPTMNIYEPLLVNQESNDKGLKLLQH